MTRNFRKSRFISINKIWTKRQATCGAMATVVASVFRSIDIPVKLVDGWHGGIGENYRHAWNEIYVPVEKKYVPFDVTRKTCRLNKKHTRRHAWSDWSELEAVYKSRDKVQSHGTK